MFYSSSVTNRTSKKPWKARSEFGILRVWEHGKAGKDGPWLQACGFWPSSLLSLASFQTFSQVDTQVVCINSSHSLHKQCPSVTTEARVYPPGVPFLSLGEKTETTDSPRLWKLGQSHLHRNPKVPDIRVWFRGGASWGRPTPLAPGTLWPIKRMRHRRHDLLRELLRLSLSCLGQMQNCLSAFVITFSSRWII